MKRYEGRERRRRDPLSRLRRIAYGVMLGLGAPLASAAGSGDAVRTPQKATVPDEVGEQHFAALVFLQGLAAEHAQPVVFGSSFSRPALGERSEMSLSSIPPPVRSGLLTLSFSDNDLRNWRRGAGLDIDVPDMGSFRLNFFSRGRDALKRWSLSPREDAPDTTQRHWSLGGSVDWTRTGPDGERQLVFVPKLAINAAALLKTHGTFDICIQYAHWTSRQGEPDPGRVPQAVVRWSF